MIWRFRFIIYLKHAPSFGDSGSSKGPSFGDNPEKLQNNKTHEQLTQAPEQPGCIAGSF